jgi:WD40 repeat protein
VNSLRPPDPGAPRWRLVNTFATALRREAHLLSARPDLLWQQLHNRLQWEDEPVATVLAPERERRGRLGSAPWLRLKTPLRESESLLRTLRGHTDAVNACAISPDGSFAVSASADRTLKVWLVEAAVERATLAGHTGSVLACAISPDCSFIVSASEDHTLRVWDADAGGWKQTLTGHTGPVRACAISADGGFVVSASDDRTLMIWDPETGVRHRMLAGHAGPVQACAVSPDGSFILSAAGDATLRIWEAGTGDERATLPLLGKGTCVAVHPRRPFAVCGDDGGGAYLLNLVGIEYGPII